MKETKFIGQNQEKWADFEEMLRNNRRNPDQLNNLFIQITDDLSYARTFYPNRSVRMYLNTLAQRVFYDIYRGRRFPVERLRRFWTDELPQLFWQERRALLLAFCLFALAFSIGVVSSMIDADFARIILGDEYVQMTEANITNGDPMAVYKAGQPGGMATRIAANNLFVSFQTAIFGVLSSLGTVFILLFNGVMVGAFQYFFIGKGVFMESFLTIWIHGTLEISSIVIAGAAGLTAGSGLLFPGTYTRGQAFQISIRRGMKMFFGIVPIIVLAAFFESFFTRYTGTPAVIRAAFIATSLAFVLWYFVWLPRHKALSGAFREPVRDKEIPPTRTHVIDFNVIKSAGETLSETFTLVRRHPKTVLWALPGTTALFALWAFGFSARPVATTVIFSDVPGWPFDVLAGLDQFFSNETAPYLFFWQALLLTGLTVTAFRAMEQEMDETQRPPVSPRRILLSALPLALVMAACIFLFRWWDTSFNYLLCMAAYPFLALWSAVIYFENPNPLTSLLRTFGLIRWWPALVLGFLISSLQVLLLAFLDFPIWDQVLRLLSWLVPQTDGAMAAFSTIATAGAGALMLYFIFLLTILSGGLLYFSCREIADAPSLFRYVEKVGTARQIRGLAKE